MANWHMNTYTLLKQLRSTVRGFLLLVMANVVLAVASLGAYTVYVAVDGFVSEPKDAWFVAFFLLATGLSMLGLVFNLLKEIYQELPWDKMKLFVLGKDGVADGTDSAAEEELSNK